MLPAFSLRLLLIYTLTVCVLSIYVDEAYNIDFHYALIGQPQVSNTFFHQPVKNSKASLLYTFSDKSILAALNPKDGAIVWRHRLPSNASSSRQSLRVGAAQDIVFAAAGSKASAWNAADGKLVWENDYSHFSVDALAIEDVPETSLEPNNIFISLIGGPSESIIKLDGATGNVQWAVQDQSGSSNDKPFALLTSSGLVHAVSLHSNMLKGGFKLKITTLNANDGRRKAQHTLNTDNDIKSPNDISFVGSGSNSPILVWTDAARKTLKIYSAGANNFQSFDISTADGDVESISVHTIPNNIGVNGPARFVVCYQDATKHWADVFEYDSRKPSIHKVYTLPSMPERGTFSAGVVDKKIYFVRLTSDHATLLSSTSEKPLAIWDVTYNIPGLVDKPAPLHAVTEIMVRSSSNHAVRAAVLMSSGDWVLIRNGQTSWSRPEALASIARAEWATLAEKESLSEDLKTEASGNILMSFAHRFKRHIAEAQNMAVMLRNFQTTFLGKILSSSSTASGDAFGFHKLLVVRTSNHRLVVLDMGNKGHVVWNVDGLGENGRCEAKNNAEPIFDQLSCLGRLAPSSINAPQWYHLEQYQEPYLKFEDAVVRTNIEKDLQPGVEQTTYSFHDGLIEGYSKVRKKPLWQFSAPPGHRVHSVQAQMSFEPVASLGKALSDRSVLYKYLNPNAIVVITLNDEKRQAIASLIDAISGRVLYSSKQENVDTLRPITSTISENRMVFSYTMDSVQDSVSKGFQLVVAEFYESHIPNDRGPLGAHSNYSTLHGHVVSMQPYVYSQAFHVPEEITQMAVTQTGQGITSRQLLVGMESSNSIVAIPPYAVDPRRLVGKDPTSAQQYEEGLSRYTPMIDFDPQWYLNHREEIFGLERILTSPSFLESTSLVLAYGLDVFGTRISPSFAFDILGADFNKVQLLLTVVGLLAGVFVVAPIIERKQTNNLWQVT